MEGEIDGLQRFIGILHCFVLAWFVLHLGVRFGEVDGDMGILETETQSA